MKDLLEKVLEYVEDAGLKSEFVGEFEQWASTSLLDSIKEDIVKENDTRYFALEDLDQEDEEYQEIEEMSDVELYDKFEKENYIDQDEIDNLWYDQITQLGRSTLNEFCSDFNDLYLNGELTELDELEETQQEDDGMEL